MSIPRGYGLNGKSIYMNTTKPMVTNVQFTVTATNGLGVTSLKSNGYVENVFMHTSTTPTTGTGGFLNPNPAVGFAIVQMKQCFNKFLGATASFVTPNTGSIKIDNSALTVGQVYVITTLGDATTAQWVTLGVTPGVTPAVGLAFTALLVGVAGEANTSTSRVSTPTTSGITQVEVVGSTDLSINSSIATNAGQQIVLQFSGATDSATTTLIPKAPAAGTVVNLQLWFDGSSVTVDGL